MALPMLALWLLVARPEIDVRWEDHGAHFGLVFGTAVINVALGVSIIRAAARRRDARLFLVALAFLVAAGFLGLHALATPGILLGKNGGFVIATPVGLFLAALLAVASSIELREQSAARLLRLRTPLVSAAGALIVGWGAWSLGGLPPLDRPLPPEEAEGPLLVPPWPSGCSDWAAALLLHLGGAVPSCSSASSPRSCCWRRRCSRSPSAAIGTRRGGSGTSS
jgi:hypothetical protein